MALPTLPPEPMVQGRSMRTGTAEATAFSFAIFRDRYPIAVVRKSFASMRARIPEAAIHGRGLHRGAFVKRSTARFVVTRVT